MQSHDEYLELCALSTSGELTEPERRRLESHLVRCAECREALEQFKAVVEFGVPALAGELSKRSSEPFPPHIAEPIRATPSVANSAAEPGDASREISGGTVQRGFAFAQPNGQSRAQINWSYVWLPFAACVLLTVTLGTFAYRIGENRGLAVSQTTKPGSSQPIEALEQQISDVAHEREGLRAELVQRESVLSNLRHEIQTQSASLDAMKSAQSSLEASIHNGETEKQQLAQEKSNLLENLKKTQESLLQSQSQIDLMEKSQTNDDSRVESLAIEISELRAQLRERERLVSEQQDLLAHDRDVRELMGARDLYIAEIYDVARTGVTQKPYGRVFYTRGKSLIFYAYDLDQEAGVRTSSTFQAWGQRGPDRHQALSLGIFFEDNAAKKRWVLKSDDSKTLDQINAVFVTVEPSGGSHTPSGSPLLFAYLKIEPNHP
jgi:uncharacterized protein YoxC